MMKILKVFWYTLLGIIFCMVLIRCDDDEQKASTPEIISFEFGYKNTDLVNYEVNLNVSASVIAESSVDKIKLEIKPQGMSPWAFDSTYIEFTGFSNASFSQNITIPFTTDSCRYKIIFTVSDLEGNKTFKEEELLLVYTELPISLPYNILNGFIIDAAGTKLLATDKGLFSFNETARKYIKVQSDIELIPSNDLAQSTTGLSNDLWIASNNGVFNTKSQIHLTSENSELLNNYITRINIDNHQVLYLATPDGISIKKNDTWYENLGLENLYLNYPITDLATASNGYTYVTTNGGGVERFKFDVDGISGATVFDTDWSKLKSNTVFTVFIDDTLQAYGTDMGVAMHFSEYTKWDWENYTTLEGLINDSVLSIIKDKSNNWWFGTTQGISKLEGSTWTNYTAETDGIISNTIKFMAIDMDGSLWLGTDKGLSHFKNKQWINY